LQKFTSLFVVTYLSMSKIGKKPIALPSGVTVTVDNSVVTVKGPKGTLSYTLLSGVTASVVDNTVVTSVDSEDIWNLWGLTRTLIQNMVVGVSE
jgi:large subunit ribosomal protein L6